MCGVLWNRGTDYQCSLFPEQVYQRQYCHARIHLSGGYRGIMIGCTLYIAHYFICYPKSFWSLTQRDANAPATSLGTNGLCKGYGSTHATYTSSDSAIASGATSATLA